jgi:transcriptional regulator with XRE-family HTH domain
MHLTSKSSLDVDKITGSGNRLGKKPTRLKMELVMRGLKQEWLAQQTGLPSNTISKIVNGSTPTLRNAQKIAKALGMTVDDLWPLKEGESDEG